MTDGSTGNTKTEATLEGIAQRIEENVPEELRRRRQWLVWKYKERDGKKPTKVPYDARTGAKASTADSEIWSTLDAAARALHEKPGYDGLGFVFGSGDPYAGVDLDECRNPETGELEEWAAEVVDSLGGYTEVSPSGTGVHIIVRGKAPNRKRDKVEAYSLHRYFTLTGETLEERAGVPIPERQAELDALTRKYLPASEPGGADRGGHGGRRRRRGARGCSRTRRSSSAAARPRTPRSSPPSTTPATRRLTTGTSRTRTWRSWAFSSSTRRTRSS